MNYKLSISPISGIQTDIFNATINAFRANNFVDYSHHFESEIPILFKNIDIEVEEKCGTKIYKLEIYYQNVLIKDLITIFNDVLKHRTKELSFLLEENEKVFEALDNFTKIRYLLLFEYGDKIGGFQALMTMSVEEVINVWNYFKQLGTQKKESIDELLKGK